MKCEERSKSSFTIAQRLIKTPTLRMVMIINMISLSFSLCSLQRLCFNFWRPRVLMKCFVSVCFCFLMSPGERKEGRNSRSIIPHNM